MPFTYLPVLQKLFGTSALGAGDWAKMAFVGLALFLVVEAEKALLRNIS
jgi:Ca2+-transporting ATPase